MSTFFQCFFEDYIAYVYDTNFIGYILYVLNIFKRGMGHYVNFDSCVAWRGGRVVKGDVEFRRFFFHLFELRYIRSCGT